MNIEHTPQNIERPSDTERTPEDSKEYLDKMHERLQERKERAPGEDQEKARKNAHEALAEAARLEQEKVAPTHEKQPLNATMANRQASYKATMRNVRTHMSPAAQAFSKVIHNETVEKVSDAVGNTVARPNAVLTGSLFAFVFTLAFYLIAKHFAYPLSGFETIGAFALGWAVGLLYDFTKSTITGRSN